jgi:hypothetical protein
VEISAEILSNFGADQQSRQSHQFGWVAITHSHHDVATLAKIGCMLESGRIVSLSVFVGVKP